MSEYACSNIDAYFDLGTADVEPDNHAYLAFLRALGAQCLPKTGCFVIYNGDGTVRQCTPIQAPSDEYDLFADQVNNCVGSSSPRARTPFAALITSGDGAARKLPTYTEVDEDRFLAGFRLELAEIIGSKPNKTPPSVPTAPTLAA